MITQSVLQEAAERLAAKFQPQQIILFGSYAQGTADEHSDVDLLVICSIRGSRRKLMVEMDRKYVSLALFRTRDLPEAGSGQSAAQESESISALAPSSSGASMPSVNHP